MDGIHMAGRRSILTAVAIGGVTFRSVVFLVATVLGGSLMAVAPADARQVTDNFFAGVRAELAHPGGSLPGTNDYYCRSTNRHPNPVVLVHGTGGNRQTNWATLGPLLHDEGYCVFALTYGTLPATPWPVSALGGLTEMETSAAQLAAFVDGVLAATGARHVDLIGHSEGTLMPTYWLKYLGGEGKVDKYISIAPYWKGQDSSVCDEAVAVIAGVGVDPARVWPYPECNQEQYGSPFMKKIHAGGGPYLPGITYTNILSRVDGIVEPWTDGDVQGRATTNIVVQDSCPDDRSDHLSLVSSPRTAAFVLNALSPAYRRAVPCVPVAPAIPYPLSR